MLVTVIDEVSLLILVPFVVAVILPLLVFNVHNPEFVALHVLVYVYPSQELAANVLLELNVTVPPLPFNVGETLPPPAPTFESYENVDVVPLNETILFKSCLIICDKVMDLPFFVTVVVEFATFVTVLIVVPLLLASTTLPVTFHSITLGDVSPFALYD